MYWGDYLVRERLQVTGDDDSSWSFDLLYYLADVRLIALFARTFCHAQGQGCKFLT